MEFLKVSNISKKSESGFQLNDITFTQRKFQRIAIAGETGSGKSTLLKIIAGLAQPDQGEISFEDELVKGPADTLVPGHHSIAYLSQDYELAKFLTVKQVLSYANHISDENAQIVFDVCKISHLLTRKTDQLSGGERQRIAIARLLISSPKLLLLDEPYSNLDTVYKNILKNVITDIGKVLKITIILVSHDPADTLSWASKILVMRDGKIIQKGPPEKIYRQPVDQYTAGLFGNYNVLDLTQHTDIARHLGIKSHHQYLLVRPEQFQIVKSKKNALRAKVLKTNFLGSHYEIETGLLNKPHQRIIIQSDANKYGRGEEIHLSVKSDGLHFMTPTA